MLEGKKTFLTGLKELYLPMQLTDWLSLSGAAAHWSDQKLFDKIQFLPPPSWNNLLGCRLCMHGLKYEGNPVEGE